MEKMNELVKKWSEGTSDYYKGKNEEKQLTRCGTSKDKVMIDSNYEQSEDKQLIDDLSNYWNERFHNIESVVENLRTSLNNQNKDTSRSIMELKSEWNIWRENDMKVKEMIQEGARQKFEFFANNINEIFGLLEMVKKKMKSYSNSKNNEVIFSKLEKYGKGINTLNELFKKIKEVNILCKKTITDVSWIFKLFYDID